MQDRLLRFALASNAAFSTLTGLALSLAPESIGTLMGGLPPLVLRLLGFGLIGFAGLVMWVRARTTEKPELALGITLADAGWILGSVILLLAPVEVAPVGRWLVVGIAAVVATFALLQVQGLREMGRNRRRSTGLQSSVEIERHFSAPPDVVWPIMSDLGRIMDFHPGLSDVSVEGSGPDVVRTCETPGGDRWMEEVTEWNESRRAYTVRFMSEAPDFPFPVEEMIGGWGVVPDGSGSRVTVWGEFSMRGGFFGDALAPVLAARNHEVISVVLARMDDESSNRAAAA